MSLLDSCNDIVCHGEIFKPGRIELRSWHKKHVDCQSPQDRDAQPLAFVQRLRSLNPYKHFGFKVFPGHIERVPQLTSILHGPAWKIVLLYRDPIATYASLLRAQQTNIWTFRPGRKSVDREALDIPVTYTEDSLREFSNSYNRFLNRSREIGEKNPNTFVIRYEQINDATVLASLLSFLGSQHRGALSSDYRKQFDGSLPDGFTNWHTLQDRLARDWPFAGEPAASAHQDVR